MNGELLKERFLKAVAPGSVFYPLFDYLPGVAFFAKNESFQLVCANRSFVERLGFKNEQEILGKVDEEIFPIAMARHYRQDDEEVLRTGKPKLNILELFFNVDGLPDWYLTNKLPVLDEEGKVIGVMGTVQSYQTGKRFIQPYLRIEPAIQFVLEHFKEKISIQEVSTRVGLSSRQLDRRFRDTVKMSPKEFIMKLRIKAACEELVQTDLPLMDIALRVGFYDQSSFTHHFGKHMGMTPLQFRKQRPEEAVKAIS